MAISLVQSKSGQWTTPSVSLNSNTAAGNCVVLMLTDEGGGVSSTSVAKLGGVTENFTKLADKSAAAYSAIWADPNCSGGQTSITWTDTGTPSAPTYWIAEFSGVSSASVADGSNTASGTAASWSVAFTSANAVDLWLGVLCDGLGSGTGSAGHGWTFINVSDVNGDSHVYGWQTVSSTGTATFSGTGGSNKGWCCCAAGVKGAPHAFVPDPNPGPNQAVMRSAVW